MRRLHRDPPLCLAFAARRRLSRTVLNQLFDLQQAIRGQYLVMDVRIGIQNSNTM
jgi:hypothetical protein